MRALALALLALGGLSCTGTPPRVPGTYPQTLSEWGFFEGNGATQQPKAGVVPYEVISPLYTDSAAKHRFIVLPMGERITYDDDAAWQFPTGTVIIKTFAYPRDARAPAMGERLMETRLLVNEPDGWHAMTYVWNDAQTEATLNAVGADLPVSYVDAAGATQSVAYRVPNRNECARCHASAGAIHPIGPRTRQLDRDNVYGGVMQNQLEHLQSLGLLDHAPAAARTRLVDPRGTASLDERTRSYLDSNCGHCHRETGAAGSTGLWLDRAITDAYQLGICKPPVAAGAGTGGMEVDIYPGNPMKSIVLYRMQSTVADVKMPEIGTTTVHADGVALVREWIAAMPPPSGPCGR